MVRPDRPDASKGAATLADLLAIPEEERYHEVIDGEVTPMAAPSGEHGASQGSLREVLGPFDKSLGGRWPGGWWLTIDTEIQFRERQIYRPDAAGWRRDRVPERPRGFPVTIRPDWVAEVVSSTASSRRRDRVKKLTRYHEFGVPHYWLLDPEAETLEACRWTPDGYLVVCAATLGDRVRTEPFEAIELEVAVLFGHDPTDEPPP